MEGNSGCTQQQYEPWPEWTLGEHPASHPPGPWRYKKRLDVGSQCIADACPHVETTAAILEKHQEQEAPLGCQRELGGFLFETYFSESCREDMFSANIPRRSAALPSPTIICTDSLVTSIADLYNLAQPHADRHRKGSVVFAKILSTASSKKTDRKISLFCPKWCSSRARSVRDETAESQIEEKPASH